MSDAFWVALFTSLPATIAATVSAVVSIVTVFKLATVHRQINSRMDELLDVTAAKSHAEGMKEEKDRNSNSDSK